MDLILKEHENTGGTDSEKSNPKEEFLPVNDKLFEDGQHSSVQSQLDSIRKMLDAVENNGVKNMSKREKDELLELKRRMMMIQIEGDSDADVHKKKRKEDKLKIKEEREAYKKLGGIPRLPKFHPDNMGRGETDNGSGLEDSDNDSQSVASGRHAALNAHRSRRQDAPYENQNDILRALVGKLDNRAVPSHESFDEKSGQSLRLFLESFEKYCCDYIKGDSRLWLTELEGKLNGETLKAFKYHKGCDENFISMKHKLIQWYEDVKDDRKERYKADFNKIKYDNKESLYGFSMKVEKAYKLAYPRGRAETSSTLRDQFLKTVPRSFKKAVQA